MVGIKLTLYVMLNVGITKSSFCCREKKEKSQAQGDRLPGMEKERRKTQQNEGESQGSHHMTQVEGAKTETSSMRQARSMAKKEWENCIQDEPLVSEIKNSFGGFNETANSLEWVSSAD